MYRLRLCRSLSSASRLNRLTDAKENSHKHKVHSVGCKVAENCKLDHAVVGDDDDDARWFGLFVFYGFPV